MAGELVVSTINGAGFDGGNVVINPEFTINQRGAASRTATSSAYNFDRWYYDGTNLLQGVEGNNLRAGTYVISWEGSSTAAFSLNTAAAGSQGGQSYTSVTNGGTITIASVGSNNLWIRFTGDLTNLTKVKVSPGTEASSFVARPYGTELALCQRYGLRVEQQQNMGGVSSAAAATNTRFTFPVTMRATPTASLITAGSWIVGNDFSANFTAASASIIAQNLTPAGGRVNVSGFTFSSNVFVAGTDVAGTAVMFMSAEL